MIESIIFGVGLTIFVTYMYFLVKMINTSHEKQKEEFEKDPEIQSWKVKAMKAILEELADSENSKELETQEQMELLIFIIGVLIFSSYVLFSFTEKEEKEEVIKIDDFVDYDGHGNWGRFPPKKKKHEKEKV